MNSKNYWQSSHGTSNIDYLENIPGCRSGIKFTIALTPDDTIDPAFARVEALIDGVQTYLKLDIKKKEFVDLPDNLRKEEKFDEAALKVVVAINSQWGSWL